MKPPDQSFSSAGVPARYVDLAHRCREYVVEEFTKLFRQFLDQIPDILLNLADQAESNVMQAHCMDVRQEMSENQDEMVQLFYNELMAGFENFILGKRKSSRSEENSHSTQKPKRLSLVEKETFEIELAFDTIANGACINNSELLFALNLRLATINGGHKPGERSASLPGGPHHVCNAYRSALTTVQIPIDTSVKISLIEAIDKHVLHQTEPIYKRYNEILSKGGILPNLEDNPIYTPEESGQEETTSPVSQDMDEERLEEQAKPPSESSTARPRLSPQRQDKAGSDYGAETQEEVIEKEVYQQISQLLHQRRGVTTEESTPPSAPNPQEIAKLVSSLTQKADTTNPTPTVPADIAYQPIEQIRAEFSTQIAQLSEIIKQNQLNHSDADVIELVGMLFELVLNDHNLPDAVKALLSHLHTPYLKVALLDRKFFFKRRHPARRLLNLLTQAGAMCNATMKNEQAVFNQMRKTVNWVLTDFDDNIELFEEIFQKFEEFLNRFQQQARIIEKRSIEKARGQEKLREARQAVARELIAIIRGKNLPKAAEKLLFGPWSNLLVLLYLRQGAESDSRQHYLQVTREIVWSVQPKISSEDQFMLRQKLTKIKRDIQEGLALLGDPESSADQLLNELESCHNEALASRVEATPQKRTKLPLSDPLQYHVLRDIDSDEILGQEATAKEDSAELQAIIRQLQKVKLGTWFELKGENAGPPLRAKLSWFSTKTSYYIFVNQSGIQIAVKPLKKLAREIQQGNARIITIDKKPFVERTLQRIFSALRQPQVS